MADDFELIADARAGAIDGVSGKLENAARVEANLRDAERTNVLFDVDDALIAIEKHEIDGEHHAERVHAVTGNDPESTAGAIPIPGLAEQSDKTANVRVRGANFGCHEAIARFVVHVNFGIVIQDTRTSVLKCPIQFFLVRSNAETIRQSCDCAAK
jgi:hypothetical protein